MPGVGTTNCYGTRVTARSAPEALRRIAQIYRLERELGTLSSEQRLARRHSEAKPLWEQLHAWLQLERSRVPDGGITAKAIDYSLKNWPALTHHLFDGEVSVDNNSLENLIRPWALGRNYRKFAIMGGSLELYE
ncbi:protein of unknown function (plasmid) [Cupriavidus taiwanensis]|uniref:Transposase IS66 central domain-containing protein n=1 Tax=Cupriavidus taiwanensis TaxID=164546 RepID=A0A375FLA6_9BURK|nr:transposase [Cupriavidus taiwanensis]SOZ71272.1 protein of unknown function [Cupriavidus taiwanensis]SOZ72327.1 protein of unknown function [Cupriavidus taiwanensis]SOZ74618.1 protein of unknown function [Cupriavidus taiwanensis]SPA03535.1 protein of unknown function [Cupriavidus taiwanensis]SPA11433.1 protein of unknown function [Cupriavidus taiwanensis]